MLPDPYPGPAPRRGPASIDIANPHLDLFAGIPADLTTTLATDPATGEQRLIGTIRQGRTTMTVSLTKAEAAAWIAGLTARHDKMTSLHPPDGNPR